MSEIILTKEIAEQFHQDPQSVDLNSYGEISEDAAEVLSEFYYYFEGENEFTFLTAKTLSRYDGFVKINSEIEEMFDELDPIIKNHKGGLSFGIIELTDSDAEKLSEYEGKLDLYEVASLSITASEQIIKHKGEVLEFGGYITNDGFYHEGISFCNETLSILSNYNGALILGIRNLLPKQAEILLNHKGELIFTPALQMLSDEAASYLSKFNNLINGNPPSHFIREIKNKPILDINIAKTFIDEGGDSSFKKLYYHTINLEDYQEITTEAARFLCKHIDHFTSANKCRSEGNGGSLAGLIKIDLSVLEIFSNHTGDIDLSGIKTLSDQSAKLLAKHQGELLLGIQALSADAAESLSNHKGQINDMNPKEWIESLKNNE